MKMVYNIVEVEKKNKKGVKNVIKRGCKKW